MSSVGDILPDLFREVDPAVKGVLEAVLPSQAATDSDVFRGPNSSETVGHIEERIPADAIREDFNLVSLGIFVGRYGLELLRLAAERRQRLEADFLDDLWSGFIWIYAEIDKGSGVAANQVLTIVVRPGASRERAENVVRNMRSMLPGLSGALGMTQDEFYGRLDEALDEAYPGLVARALGGALEALADIFEFTEKGAVELADFLKKNSRMPEALWSPRHRPDDWAAFLNNLKGDQTKVLDQIEKDLSNIQSRVLIRVNTAEKFLPLSARTVSSRFKAVWNWIFNVLYGTIITLRELKPDTAEMADAFLGFVSGLWDGIMDAVIGFIEMVALGLKLAAANVRLHKGLGEAVEVVLEFAELITGAVKSIDFEALLDWTKRAWPFLWRAARDRAENFFDKIVSNTAMAGYYFGYLVYMVIEFFLPPLKFSSLASNARRLASMRFFIKVLT